MFVACKLLVSKYLNSFSAEKTKGSKASKRISSPKRNFGETLVIASIHLSFCNTVTFNSFKGSTIR